MNIAMPRDRWFRMHPKPRLGAWTQTENEAAELLRNSPRTPHACQ